jgi:hypothetical protein
MELNSLIEYQPCRAARASLPAEAGKSEPMQKDVLQQQRSAS